MIGGALGMTLAACQAAPSPPAPQRPLPSAARTAPAPTLPSAEARPSEQPKPPSTAHGPACPAPTDRAEAEVPNLRAAIERQRPSFAACASDGRGASTEVTWIVPPKGRVTRLASPEPEPYEWCLLRKVERVNFRARPPRTVFVHLRLRVEGDKSVSYDLTQAEAGKAVVCAVETSGATAEGTDGAARALADSMTVCYRQAQRSDPAQAGQIEVGLRLADDGTVREVEVRGERRTDLVQGCVRSTAALARFPMPKGPASVQFSLRFVTK